MIFGDHGFLAPPIPTHACHNCRLVDLYIQSIMTIITTVIKHSRDVMCSYAAHTAVIAR